MSPSAWSPTQWPDPPSASGGPVHPLNTSACNGRIDETFRSSRIGLASKPQTAAVFAVTSTAQSPESLQSARREEPLRRVKPAQSLQLRALVRRVVGAADRTSICGSAEPGCRRFLTRERFRELRCPRLQAPLESGPASDQVVSPDHCGAEKDLELLSDARHNKPTVTASPLAPPNVSAT
jgi:hypothetical protein